RDAGPSRREVRARMTDVTPTDEGQPVPEPEEAAPAAPAVEVAAAEAEAAEAAAAEPVTEPAPAESAPEPEAAPAEAAPAEAPPAEAPADAPAVEAVTEALRLTTTADVYDVDATIAGGGVSGQAGALRLGIARALVELDPEVRVSLKRAGLLSRDAREKESKKYGLKKARKAPQYSK